MLQTKMLSAPIALFGLLLALVVCSLIPFRCIASDIEIELLSEREPSRNFMGASSSSDKSSMATAVNPAHRGRATFAAGCFWGTQKWFQKQFGPAVSGCKVGYVGGAGASNPGYRAVCTGTTGHAEAATFAFDESKVSYSDLLYFFFSMHNPTTLNRQGNDAGSQYRSAVFWHTPEQKELAERMIAEANTPGTRLNKLITDTHGANARVVTTVEDGTTHTFWDAETDHQDYLTANPGGYCNHRLYFKYE
jgi:peptide-methionine (S)-S-oxide reductase